MIGETNFGSGVFLRPRLLRPAIDTDPSSLQMEVLHLGDHSPSSSSSGSPQTLDFSWVSILWQRGFQHRNPQVRQAVLASFFECQSESATWVAQITEQFVLGPLWGALNDPVQHVGLGRCHFLYFRPVSFSFALSRPCLVVSLNSRYVSIYSLLHLPFISLQFSPSVRAPPRNGHRTL
jgi:hypothetical protein